MTGARKLRRDIMLERGLREAIFSDAVLREMGLELPIDLDEMRVIPGIREEMVDRYGRRFLPLIGNSRRLYRGNVPKRRYLQPTRGVTREVSNAEDDEEEDQVLDPNHRNVIDLCSEDEIVPPVADDAESDYSDFEYEEDDDDGEPHISHHFNQQVDPEVEAFNNRMTQLGPAVPKTTSRAPAARGGSKAPGAKKGQTFRKSGSGSFGKTNAGVRKRAPKGSGSRGSGGAAAKKATGGARRGGDSGGGGTLPGTWGAIMAMPTN